MRSCDQEAFWGYALPRSYFCIERLYRKAAQLSICGLEHSHLFRCIFAMCARACVCVFACVLVVAGMLFWLRCQGCVGSSMQKSSPKN